MSENAFSLKSPRIEVIDALRGLAIMAIMLLHNLEHFDFYYLPEYLPEPIKVLDKVIWDTLFFLFAGKSYAIFSLLFGFSFFIQYDNQRKKGNDFRWRYVWRLAILFVFGLVNTIFFSGDILMMYAVLGLILIPVCNLSTKYVLIIATFLLSLPMEWFNFFNILYNPDYILPLNLSNAYYGNMHTYLSGDSFVDHTVGNLSIGRWASVFWSWENGRFFQAPALFMFGMIAGRKQLFVASAASIAFWKKALICAIILFIPLFAFKTYLPELFANKDIVNSLLIIFTSWSNVTFMVVLVSTFVLLYQKEAVNKVLIKLIPFGKMSLTSYFSQSILGSFIYYRYGLGLYQYTGATFGLIIGIILFLLQLGFCTWWLKKHKQGPLEALWHKLTWISFGKEKKTVAA
ncbi:DUF418 domain-containing protein [Flavobacterium sp. LS1R47]|uniref:DUF418 domain-containing protein n=1 Tax=Flavobacterium frigoritolerans TaxID=2987686 RepID=A0A9X3CAE6_9FLAO|nr:DUF418 domain-containing protein [Flavobacterium frigoritolerans]MCV9934575.1 DUF418 domain-containing protein [Flavobacterium frigoritolerans]